MLARMSCYLVCQLNPLIVVDRFSLVYKALSAYSRYKSLLEVDSNFARISIFDNAKFEGLVWRVPAACCHLVLSELSLVVGLDNMSLNL